MEGEKDSDSDELGLVKIVMVGGLILGSIGWGMNIYNRLSRYDMREYLPRGTACAQETPNEGELEKKVLPAKPKAMAEAAYLPIR